MPRMTVERGLHAAWNVAASLTMALPPEREVCPSTAAHVTRVRQLSPAFTRVTLAAETFRTLELLGPDEYVGLFMPPPGAPVLLPAEDERDPRAAVAAMPDDVRPDLRWYTIRELRRGDGEIDVDIVSVGHDGPGARWVRCVDVGDEVGVRVQSALYGAAPPDGHHLLVADETGLPGMLAILDANAALAPASRPRLTSVLEVPDGGYVHAEVLGADIQVVQRGSGTPGSALRAALPQLDLEPVDYAWVCAEGGTVAAVRRHLTKDRGVSRRAVTASGFWSVGRPRP